MIGTTKARRAVAVASIAGLLTLAACSDDSTPGNGGGGGGSHTLIAGHQLAEGTPFDDGMHEFARLVEEKTDGQVTVEVHPNAALGTEPEMFQSMQTGTMDVAIIAPASLAEFMPEMSLLSIPFLVTDRDQRDAIIEGEIGTYMAETLDASTGVQPMTYFGGSYRQMFFTDPAESFDDLRGRLIRVQPANVLTDSYSAMGMNPTVVAYTELYNALGQGVVEGADNEAVFIDSQNFFEVAPYILRTNHEVTIRPLLIATSTLDSMGDELAALVQEAAVEAGTYQRDLEAQVDDEMLEDLAGRDGVTVSDIDTSGVLEQVEPVWRQYAAEWDAEDMLEDIIALRPSE